MGNLKYKQVIVMKTRYISYAVFAVVLVGCGKTLPISSSEDQILENTIQKESVPFEDAMKTLTEFLSDTPLPLSVTKGDGGRVVKNSGVYYSQETRKESNPTPDAYVLNFEEGKGFAILGANDRVAPIIAVTDKGSVDPETLQVSAGSCAANENTARLSEFIESLLRVGATPVGGDRGLGDGGNEPAPFYPDEPGDPGPDGPNIPYIHYSAHINTTWDQGEWNSAELYNNYCYENFLFDGFMYVLTGCSTTAMAGIVEYNRFPTTLTVNNKTLNYAAMDEYPNANWLSSGSAKDDVGRLMGAIYHNVFRLFIRPDGTCITPAQIENCMNLFGYTNVVRLQGSSFTSEMKTAIKEMLNDNKPVFISAIPSSNISKAHSWVIDEIKGRKTHEVHCNWGWSGLCDGFFSTSCFDPTGDVFDFHFRVITYDIPSGQVNKSFDF